MITCHLLDGRFREETFEDFEGIRDSIDRHRETLAAIPLDAIIAILNLLGKRILNNPEINRLPGISFVSLWLRRENLDRICQTNYSDKRFLDGFISNQTGTLMMAQPRGIVCQWIAANMPTLGFFSMVQCMLSKNGSILKMPIEYIPLIRAIFNELPEITVDHGGKTYSGQSILNANAIVSFEGRSSHVSEMFSLSADCRIIYGGSEAVRAISRLPVREHCETIIFGPKYSFAVFDRDYIESEGLVQALDKFARDIAVFNQMACSSPHVLFLEKSRFLCEDIAKKLAESLAGLPDALRIQEIPAGLSAKIINARAQYLLSDDKNCIKPQDLSWTVFTDQDLCLEEPIQGKCIFIKEIAGIEEVIPLVSHKIQAVSIGILDIPKRESFARELTYRGVDRIVVPGTIHDYSLPWDGIMTLNRLVRWVVLKDN